MKAIKSTTKRNSHSYKCLDAVYNKARKRAIKEKKTPLATIIESFVVAFSKGENITILHTETGFNQNLV